MLFTPLLSVSDPVVGSEGSVDPLSLSPIYDRLADRILPSLTVRMRRIRFVTAMCVAARVCADDYDEDNVASDGVTPPWLVFEWFAVEALVRKKDELDDADGVPGGTKVRHAISQRRPICHLSYLKTPKVFGFSGIFRRFVTEASVLTDDLLLDDGGYTVLRAWEKDVGLDGFQDGADTTPGGQLRKNLRNAVRAGMEAGTTVKRSPEFWSEMARVLEPGAIKHRERKALLAQLVATAKGGIRGHADELVKALQKRGATLDRYDEAKFLRSVARNATPDLASCLRAIDAYEALCRPVVDAFDLIRVLSTENDRRPTSASDFAKHRLAAKLVGRMSAGVRRVEEDEHLGVWEPPALVLARTFSHARTATELFDTVMQHHEEAQKAKPPDGKRPWFERTPGRQASIRLAYAFAQVPALDDTYVHQYRLPTLSRFLAELQVLS
jgi:hypothetical protein